MASNLPPVALLMLLAYGDFSAHALILDDTLTTNQVAQQDTVFAIVTLANCHYMFLLELGSGRQVLLHI
jgi:hypothetical protein